uniref:U2A'/phosphoprotein 32 family A C-terminal domain-containing protein n=1 Tax=Ciona savignyi TaxID=51511 RepID=H2YA28_CIOSA
MNSNELIIQLLKKQGIKQDSNVVELYLGKHGLTSINSLGRFRQLQRLWLNGNCLRSLIDNDIKQSFLKNNHRITELHLQCNELSSVAGCLSHLRYLQVLMLQKNQLVNLNAVLHEISPLHALRVLNLFDNPVAHESGYRLLVIHSLPSVALLDREAVTSNERKRSKAIHEPEREAVEATVAFWRRADPTSINRPPVYPTDHTIHQVGGIKPTRQLRMPTRVPPSCVTQQSIGHVSHRARNVVCKGPPPPRKT